MLLNFFKKSIFWILVLLANDTNESAVHNPYQILRKELFENRSYDPVVRPVRNFNRTIEVNIGLDLFYITELNHKSNILFSEGFLRLYWADEHLTWVPSQYENITNIRVSVDEVFRPDITLYNAVTTENIVRANTHSDLQLTFFGLLDWMPALSMSTLCQVDLTEWPYDSQTCRYIFGSWSFWVKGGLKLVNESNHIHIGELRESPSWEIVETSCKMEVETFEGFDFSKVTYSVTLKRKTTVYRYTVYLPVLCALMLNLGSLLLDTQSWLRFRLSGLSFLTLVLEQLYLANRLGLLGGATVPKVVTYVGQMMVLVALTCIWSAFSLNFIKSRLTVPSPVMRALEPVQPWLVNNEVTAPGQPFPPSQSNVVFVQIADKVLCALFAILMIGLHN